MSPNLTDKIQSIRQSLGGVYKRPDTKKLINFQNELSQNTQALDYLRIQRGLTDDTIKHFALGYDKEKNAIAIPVFKRGELINIKYRLISPKEGTPKYTQEKDAEVWIYNEEGIQRGMEKKNILVVEGEFDLMSVWQAGFKAVVSPASGKDSYGVWLELLDNIPKVFINYDNDKPGRETAMKLAERVGIDKCHEVLYPEGIKDANEYFKAHTSEDYKKLILNSRPFYVHQYKGVVDIINDLRLKKQEKFKSQFLPNVKIGEGWIIVVSGKENVGKTSYVMNIVNDLIQQNIPCLVLPFERGVQVVGARYLQIKHSLSEGDFDSLTEEEWNKIIQENLDAPLFFSRPKKEETVEIIKKAKRIFNTKFVIVDHLDYMVRFSNSKNSETAEISATLRELKDVAEECKTPIIIVHHIRKIDFPGATKSKKPGIQDLKGSASTYQDPECVVILSSPNQNRMTVDVVKNKGKMTSKTFSFNEDTGKLSEEKSLEEETIMFRSLESQQLQQSQQSQLKESQEKHSYF